METFITVMLSIYVGIALYEFYMSFLMGDDLKLCVMRGITWPESIYYLVKEVFWNYRNLK